jgi:4-amino-4-deoxy-L-arabinose transferase-like glycosyltransferase
VAPRATIQGETGPETGRASRTLAAWLVIAVVILAAGIGSYPLIEPDEGRNAEVAREMAATGNYVLPHLNGLPYLDKPVVFFAAAALAIDVFGATEFAARLAPFLFGLATVVLVGWFARRRFGIEAGALAAIATLTAPLTVGLSRTVIMDTALSFFVVLALISFHEAVEASSGDGSSPRTRWTLLAWGAMALGVLTKGPVALAVPLLAAAPFAVWRRASRAVWHPLGPLVLVAIVAPWVWAVSLEIPNFLRYVVVTETWARMTSDELRRTEPLWFFLPVILAGSFPWWLLAFPGIRPPARRPREAVDPTRVFLWLWLLLPLVLFSLSRGKQEQYVLPLVPAVALLAAGGWSERPHGVRAAAACWAGVGLLMGGAALAGVPGLDPGRVPEAVAVRTAVGIGVAALAGALVAWWFVFRRRDLAVIGLSLPLLAIPVVAAPVLQTVAAQRSAHSLAEAVGPRIEAGAEALWVEAYAGGLSFYLERAIPVATSNGDELRSNYILRNYRRFVDSSDLLVPMSAAEVALHDCTAPKVFLIDTGSSRLGAEIVTSRVPLWTTGRRWLAYGPECVPTILSR